MIEETLKILGLSREEIEVYLALLEYGSLNASTIASKTHVKRTYVYKICEDLLSKGLISATEKVRGNIYTPLSPDYLLALSEKKKQEVLTNAVRVEGILDTLKLKYTSIEERPTVRTFEGYEGLKKIYLDTIKEGQTIYAFLQNSDINKEFRQWLRERYLKDRVENKILAKVIIASGELSQMYTSEDQKNYRESIVVDSKDFPFEVEVNIYGTKIALINFKNQDNPIGIIIDNKAIANTLRAFFELNWKTLQLLSPSKVTK